MSLGKYRLKLQKNKDFQTSGGPQYTLKYSTKSDNPRHVSHAILSAMIGNDDVILLVSTEFFSNLNQKGPGPVEKFIERARSHGLFLVQRSRPVEQKISFFGFQSRMKKKVEVQEVAAYVPNQVWRDSFADILPLCGARYFVTPQTMSVSTFINHVLDMSEEEIAKTFKTRIFDLAQAGQMGISSDLSLEEISHRLGLSKV